MTKHQTNRIMGAVSLNRFGQVLANALTGEYA
jgi:hypothetical protein